MMQTFSDIQTALQQQLWTAGRLPFLLFCMPLVSAHAKLITYFEIAQQNITGRLDLNDNCASPCGDIDTKVRDLVAHNNDGITPAASGSDSFTVIKNLCYGVLNNPGGQSGPTMGYRVMLQASNNSNAFSNFDADVQSACDAADASPNGLKTAGIVIGCVVAVAVMALCIWAYTKNRQLTPSTDTIPLTSGTRSVGHQTT